MPDYTRGKYCFTGIAVGNGFTDPVTLLDYSTYLHQLGLVDKRTSEDMRKFEERGKAAIREGRYHEAHYVCTNLIIAWLMEPGGSILNSQ